MYLRFFFQENLVGCIYYNATEERTNTEEFARIIGKIHIVTLKRNIHRDVVGIEKQQNTQVNPLLVVLLQLQAVVMYSTLIKEFLVYIMSPCQDHFWRISLKLYHEKHQEQTQASLDGCFINSQLNINKTIK